ncbi:MAG: hypothetical protein KFF46_00150, partial [Desulfobacterales bacterium]|nr:hypothetical protein [Desulfobacterales bacterium]
FRVCMAFLQPGNYHFCCLYRDRERFVNAGEGPEDMDLPGLRLPPLKGERHDFRAVADVSGDWRALFRFEKRQRR